MIVTSDNAHVSVGETVWIRDEPGKRGGWQVEKCRIVAIGPCSLAKLRAGKNELPLYRYGNEIFKSREAAKGV